jgi:TRAP-type transport system periplasmic protein
MAFNTPDVKPFQDMLKKGGFFGEMKKKSGDQAWALLEKYVGPLA